MVALVDAGRTRRNEETPAGLGSGAGRPGSHRVGRRPHSGQGHRFNSRRGTAHHPRQTRSRHHHRGGPRELQGGNSEMLTVPQTGGNTVPSPTSASRESWWKPAMSSCSSIPPTGVQPARGAKPIWSEAGSRSSGRGDGQALDEETRYQVESTTADVKLAELEIRKNPLLAAIVARQNALALDAANNRQQSGRQEPQQQEGHRRRRVSPLTGRSEQGQGDDGYAQKTIDGHDLRPRPPANVTSSRTAPR